MSHDRSLHRRPPIRAHVMVLGMLLGRLEGGRSPCLYMSGAPELMTGRRDSVGVTTAGRWPISAALFADPVQGAAQTSANLYCVKVTDAHELDVLATGRNVIKKYCPHDGGGALNGYGVPSSFSHPVSRTFPRKARLTTALNQRRLPLCMYACLKYN